MFNPSRVDRVVETFRPQVKPEVWAVKPYRLGDPADALVIRWAIYPKEAWKASTIITAGKNPWQQGTPSPTTLKGLNIRNKLFDF